MNTIDVIKEAQDLLLQKQEWVKRYADYADLLIKNGDFIRACRKRSREFPPLYFYISTTYAKNAKLKLKLDLRYRGQTVAVLNVNDEDVTISTDGYEKKNKNHFGCEICLKDNSWSGVEASEFRDHFKKRENSRNNAAGKKNEEHNVQDLLLTEFSKRSSFSKQLLGIQPVKIGGRRYRMPSSASENNHKELKYADQHGGGIDVFARTGKGTATYLTVIEVKDENVSKEPPADALKQAVQYAVFIRELLRSESGEKWYKLFGFSGAIPKQLTIRAVCAMPDDILDKSFANERYPIENDFIECHYLYFKYNGKQLSDLQTSLKQ